MNLRSFTQEKHSPPFTPLRAGLLHRKCACGGSPGLTGECSGCANKRLQRSSLGSVGRGTEHEAEVPPLVHEVLRSPGQPLDVATRAFFEPRFGHDFSQVRIHADAKAAESARVVNALAYTVGRDIVFGDWQAVAGTTLGHRLLAHELTHVVQQAHVNEHVSTELRLGSSGERAEQEADRIAEQTVVGSLPLLSGVGNECGLLQRQPATPTPPSTATPQTSGSPASAPSTLAGEDPALRTRRLDAIRAARNAIQWLSGALAGGHIWPSLETVTPGGVDHAPLFNQPSPETMAAREARLRQLAADLIQMVSQLETAPIPIAWLAPVAQFATGTIQAGGATQAESDTYMFYSHRSAAMGRDQHQTFLNTFYITTAPLPNRQVARVAVRSGVELGIYIVVEDPDNAPLVYRRLSSREGWNMRGVIMEVWHDDFGYYYPYKEQKIYLPGRP